MFWPEHITKISRGILNRKIIKVSGLAPVDTHTYPHNTRWIGNGGEQTIQSIETGKKIQVRDLGNGSYDWTLNKVNSGQAWKKVKKGGLLLAVRDNSDPVVVPLETLLDNVPSALSRPDIARRTIDVQRDEKTGGLAFNVLRIKDMVRDNFDFIYYLKDNRNIYKEDKENSKARLIEYLLRSQELTVRVERVSENNYALHLTDEDMNDLGCISSDLFADRNNIGFLQNRKHGMGSMDSFYQSDSYEKTYRFRPRLIKHDGEVLLLLTRIKKIRSGKLNHRSRILNGARKIFYAVPTSAVVVKEKIGGEERASYKVPLSLSKPIPKRQLKDPGLIGRIKIESGQGAVYKRVGKIKRSGLENIVRVTYDGTRDFFSGYGLKNEAVGALNADAETTMRGIRAWLLKENSAQKNSDIEIILTHWWLPDIIEGEFQLVVHRQTQFGAEFVGESYKPEVAGQLRDIQFYGGKKSLHSEVDVPNRTFSIQAGKAHGFGANDERTPNPIENGTPMQLKQRDLLEMARISMGLPQNCEDLRVGLALEKSGGFETFRHHPYYLKIAPYNRFLGWLSGVSEDEQLKIAMKFVLGLKLMYYPKITSIEAEPHQFSKIEGQEAYRYNFGMELAADVLMPIIWRQMREYLTGRPLESTFKSMYEDYLLSDWYNVSSAELARQCSPIAFLLSGGHIKPYPVDLGYFVFGAFLPQFFLAAYQYSSAMHQLGYNKENLLRSRRGRLWWSFFEGPWMKLPTLFPGLRGLERMPVEDPQYGRYVQTALAKGGNVSLDNSLFLAGLSALSVAGLVSGTNLMRMATVDNVLDNFGIIMNMLWGTYQTVNNIGALNWIRMCNKEQNWDTRFGRNQVHNAAPDQRFIRDVQNAGTPSDLRLAHLRYLRRMRLGPSYRALHTESLDVTSSIEGDMFFEANSQLITNPVQAEQIFRELRSSAAHPNWRLLADQALRRMQP